jgi:hypothetical protein
MFLSGQEIYENFTNAEGAEGLAQGAATVQRVVAKYNERGDQIKRILGKMDAMWKGDAADAAHRGAGPLAVEHALAAPAMDAAQDLSARQAGSFNDAKNAVIPVPPTPEKVDPLAAFLAPGELVTYQQQLGRHNVAAQHNVDVMRGYENASAYNTNMPDTYGSITADQAEIRIAQATPPPPGPGDNPTQPGPGTDGPRPPAGGGGGTGSGGGQPGSAGSGSGPGSAGPGSGGPGSGGVVVPPPLGTTPGGFTPPAPGPGAGVPNVPVGAGSGPGTGGPGLGFAGTGIGPVGIPSEGTGSGGRGGAPGAGSGSGVGGRGPGAAGGPGVGGRTGAGPLGSAMAAEPAGTRGTPTGRGGPGGMPMGAGPGGRGRGGEDEEHQRASFLEEPDPEAIFGTDERTPPPVIGG